MRITNVVISYLETERDALEKVISALKGINTTAIPRTKVNAGSFSNADIVISLGGDGTFLKNARYSSVPILGVNSNPEEKEGFFTATDLEKFPRALSRILAGRCRVLELQRLAFIINNLARKTFAANEIYFGKRKSWHVAEYELSVGKTREFQRSSGVIVSTAAGSTAWFRSAGGLKLPLLSRRFGLIVREPYFGRLNKPTLIHKILDSRAVVKIRSLMNDGVVVADSSDQPINLKFGDVVSIKLSDKPVKVISFGRKFIRWKW